MLSLTFTLFLRIELSITDRIRKQKQLGRKLFCEIVYQGTPEMTNITFEILETESHKNFLEGQKVWDKLCLKLEKRHKCLLTK